MGASDLIDKVNSLLGERVNYAAYDLSKVVLTVGAPPIILHGIDYIMSAHRVPQNRMVMGLNAKGKFVSNRNKSGLIEFGLMANTISTGILEILQLAGVAFPISVIDRTTNATSAVFASKCRRVGTPEWRRAAAPELEIFTFHTPRLLKSEGVRKRDD